jgi:hypothetical protein
MIMMLLPNDNLYFDYKKIAYAHGSPSQVISGRVARKFNFSIGSNVLRQMNIKMGGELYQIQMPKECKKNTMLMGLDVCHKTKQSIVGFCCSITSDLS